MEKLTNCIAVAVVLAAVAVVVALVLSLGAVGLWVAVFAVLGLFCWSCDPGRAGTPDSL